MIAITGISALVTNDASHERGKLGIINNAALVVGDDDKIAWTGEAINLPNEFASSAINVGGRAIIPGFVDSHTHLVFGGDRATEFEARMSGKTYSAGGIRTTMAATRSASDESLAINAHRLANEALNTGTTTLEVKSGYGLSVNDEARSLQVAGVITSETTFLGAHVVPPESTIDEYVDLVCGEMLKQCAPNAKWIDVFATTAHLMSTALAQFLMPAPKQVSAYAFTPINCNTVVAFNLASNSALLLAIIAHT